MEVFMLILIIAGVILTLTGSIWIFINVAKKKPIIVPSIINGVGALLMFTYFMIVLIREYCQ